MKERAFAADENARQGNAREAVRLYCLDPGRQAREGGSPTFADPASVIDGLLGDWPSWAREARCAVLGEIGSCATPEAAQELLPMVLASLQPSGRMADNTHRAASEALAQIALVIDYDITLPDRLLQLAQEQDLTLATSGRLGLRLLADIGRKIDVDVLIDCFARDGNPQEPNPQWVADRLTTPARIASVRGGALTGDLGLTPLAHRGCAARDAPLRSTIDKSPAMLASDLV